MVNWSYYDSNGEKISVTGKELKELAKTGKITPGTMIESPEGKSAPAKRVKGLLFVAPEVILQPEQTQPIEKEIGRQTQSEPCPITAYMQKRGITSTTAPPVVEKPLNKSLPSSVPVDLTVNLKDGFGRTKLHLAAEKNDVNRISILIEKGADVNARDKDDATPLHWAASSNSAAAIQMLIDAGARINAQNKNGGTPLDVAILTNSHEVADILKKVGATSSNSLPDLLEIVFSDKNTWQLLVPFAFFAIVGIAGAYATAPSDDQGVKTDTVGITIRYISWGLIIGCGILGTYYYAIRRKKDTLHRVFQWAGCFVAVLPIVGLIIALVVATSGLGLLGIIILLPLVLSLMEGLGNAPARKKLGDIAERHKERCDQLGLGKKK
jgi:hypothetical protein